jgi:uncharacterized protein DUF3854
MKPPPAYGTVAAAERSSIRAGRMNAMASLTANHVNVKATAAVPLAAPALSDAHRNHLRTSALTDETIAAAGFWTTENMHVARAICGWGLRSRAADLVPALVLPHFALDGTIDYSYLRPDDPPVSRKTGRPIKYLSPKSLPQRPYFVPNVGREAFFEKSIPILFTEGIKKALLLAQVTGLPVISSQGVWMFHDAAHKKVTKKWRLHWDLLRVPLAGRSVLIIFDGVDTSHNSGVIRAEARNARLLMDAGARVSLARVPFDLPSDVFIELGAFEKCGADDYLARFPTDERIAQFSEIVQASLEADPLKRAVMAAASGRSAISELLCDLSFHAAVCVASKKTQEKAKAVLAISAHEWNEARRWSRSLMAMSTTRSILEMRKTTHYGRTQRYASPPRPSPAPHPPHARSRSRPLSVRSAHGTPTTPSGAEDRGTMARGSELGQPNSDPLTASDRGRRPRMAKLARRLLISLLVGGPRPSSDIKSEADKLGLKWPTVKRAKTKTGVKSEWHGRVSYWRL